MERQKILIVDDSEMNRALLVDILEEPYDVVEAANGVEAISILSKQRTDFSLLLDRRSRDTLGLKGDEIPIAAQVVALADGEECVCPQTISYSVCCKWFRWAVLPQDKALEADIFRSTSVKRCAECGAAFVPGSNRAKYCPECAARVCLFRKSSQEKLPPPSLPHLPLAGFLPAKLQISSLKM